MHGDIASSWSDLVLRPEVVSAPPAVKRVATKMMFRLEKKTVINILHTPK